MATSKNIIFLLLFTAFLKVKAQKNSPNDDFINFNIGNSTPIVGITYNKAFAFTLSKKYQKHWEASLGIGFIPYPIPLKIDLALGHSFSYLIGRNNKFIKLGYAGIYGKSQPNYSVQNNYLPSPNIGVRFHDRNFLVGIDLNGYFYKNKRVFVKDDNSVYDVIFTKLSIYPGIYLGLKFF